MTTTLLALKSDFWAHQDQLWQGTATGGATTYLTDTALKSLTSETWPTEVEGTQIRVTSGNASGDLFLVVDSDRTEGTVFPSGGLFKGAVASTDTYELWGNAIHGGAALTKLFNDVLRRLRPITQTQLTIVTNQIIYDVSASVSEPKDVLDVWLRLIDPSGQRPYTPVRASWWDAWTLAGAGTTSTVQLEIRPPLTSTNTSVQLWLEHRKAFTPFTDDTSTVDADYRDWIVWEVIYEFARRKGEQPLGDRSIWQMRAKRASEELAGLRARYNPRRPIRLRPSSPQ